MASEDTKLKTSSVSIVALIFAIVEFLAKLIGYKQQKDAYKNSKESKVEEAKKEIENAVENGTIADLYNTTKNYGDLQK